MSLRFQADADLDPDIVRGLRRREPAIDFRGAGGVIVEGTPDPEVLRIAAEAGRVLVSRDVATMPEHFARFIADQQISPFTANPFTTADWPCYRGDFACMAELV